MVTIKRKNLNLTFTVGIGIAVFIILLTLGFNNIFIVPQGLSNTLLTVAGIFIGFVIAAIGIYCSIPLIPEIKFALKKQGYYQQIIKNFVICVVQFTVVILFSIVAICIYNPENILMLQHIINSIAISVFCSAVILLLRVCVDFFKVISRS